jgi:hypothetical protein
VRLDVHHVADAKERVIVESRIRIGPVKSFRARAAREAQILFEVEIVAVIAAEILMSGLKMIWVHIFRYERRCRADLIALGGARRAL